MTTNPIPAAAPSLAQLIQELNRLPGIGPKSAQRLAYYIIRLPNDEAHALAEAIIGVKEKIRFWLGVPEPDRRRSLRHLLRRPEGPGLRYAWSRSPWTCWPWSAPTATVGSTTCSTE